jgi:ankyrin repeat protein
VLSYTETPLLLAVKANHLNIAVMLLGNGADTDCVRNDGSSVLHLCAISGNTEMAKHLVGAGANPALVDRAGVSASQLARQYSHIPVATAIEERLEAAGADA